jgi:hypothetical protein
VAFLAFNISADIVENLLANKQWMGKSPPSVDFSKDLSIFGFKTFKNSISGM